MKASFAALSAVSVLSLTANAAEPSKQTFATVVETLKTSPAFFQKTVSICVQGVRKDPGAIEFNVQLTGLKEDRAPEVSCERLMKAYRDGRYKYEHHLEVLSGRYPPEVVRIIQGR